MMAHSKRTSVSSNKHCSSVSSIDLEPNFQFERLEKSIAQVYKIIRLHLKQKKYSFEEIQLKEVYKCMDFLRKQYTKITQQHDLTINTLKVELDKYKEEKEQTIKRIMINFEEEIKAYESQTNQTLLNLNTEFGRKEQSYKELIANFIQTLNKTQKSYATTYGQLSQKCQLLTQHLRVYITINSSNQILQQSLQQIIEEIKLKHQNSIISEKSDEISIDEMDISENKLGGQAIGQPNGWIDKEMYEDEDSQMCLQKQLESWLRKLICYGIFSKQNLDLLQRMMNISSATAHYLDLLESPILSLLMDRLILNMLQNEELAEQILNGEDNQRPDDIFADDNSRVELRNIQNMSELSIS